MTELKPIIVYEDRVNIKKELKYLDAVILPHCPEIQRKFESLCLGEISNNYLNDILYNSCTEIEKELIVKIKSEIDDQHLLDVALNRGGVAVQKLRKSASILLDECNNKGIQSLLCYLSISENGNIVFSAQSKEELKESYRQYVQTPIGISRRQLHERAVKALNEFKKSMGNVDVLEYFDIDVNDNIMPVPVIYEEPDIIITDPSNVVEKSLENHELLS